MRTGDLTGYSLGEYVLRELLGRGAVGSVYRAYQPSLKRYVAIKVLTPTPDEPPSALAERFALEAHTFASLEHPHIVPIYDYGTDNGLSFIVMRLLSGGTLEERLRYRRTNHQALPSLAEVSHLLNQIADALAYAHERSVIHRDVKSGNVMFDEYGRAYLVDFSIVKLMDDRRNLTADGLIVGTPALMPPEQWRGELLTPAADQYALGALIYELVTGRLPLEAETTPALMYRHLNDVPAPAHELSPDVPKSVSRVLGWALAKDPAERYPNARLFAQAFVRAIDGAEGEPTEFFTFPLSPSIAKEEPPPSAYFTRDLSALSTRAEVAPVPVTSFPAPPPVEPYAALYESSSVRAPRRSRALPMLGGIGIGLIAVAACLSTILFGLSALLNGSGTPPTEVVQMLGGTSRPTSTAEPTTFTPEPTLTPTDSITPEPTLPPTALAPQGGAGDALRSEWQPGQVMLTLDTSVRGVAFIAGGRQLLYAGNSNTVQRSIIGEERDSGILFTHAATVYSLDARGSRIVSGDASGTIRLWDQGQITATLRGHTGAVRYVTFNRDGRLFASVGEDGAINVWDAATGTALMRFALPNRVLAAAFSPDGATLATSGTGTEIALWDLNTGTQRGSLTGHTGEVRALDYSPDGAVLASGSSDGSVRLWDTATGRLIHTLEGHARDVFAVAVSPDGTLVASGGADDVVLVWDAATGAQLNQLTGHGGWVFDVQFAADSGTIASAGGDGTARLWLRTG